MHELGTIYYVIDTVEKVTREVPSAFNMQSGRVIVALGLKMAAATSRPGLRAVMNRAGIEGKITSDQVAFQIAPRMNACGRMESAQTALEMLLTRDPLRAEALALKMEGLNQERKDQENRVLRDAMEQVERMDLVEIQAIVVAGKGHETYQEIQGVRYPFDEKVVVRELLEEMKG